MKTAPSSPATDLQIAFWPIDRVKPYEANPRQIPPDAIAKVAASIREFGWRQPIVVDEDGVVIAGHTRLLAAQSLGLDQVPVHVADLDAEKARAYRIADNRTGEEARWDLPLLRIEMAELAATDFSLIQTGFDPEELQRMFPPALGTDDDDAPRLPAEPVSRAGDRWVLGPHTLLVGDCGMASAAEVMAGQSAAMAYTQLRKDTDPDALCSTVLGLTDGATYIAASPDRVADLREAYDTAGGHWSTYVIWTHDRPGGRGHYKHQYQPILYGWREGSRHYWCGDRNQGDVWGGYDTPTSGSYHHGQQPVALLVRAMMNSSKPGDLVLDPCAGIGTTIIAGERAGRQVRAVESDPKRADVAIRRWQAATGRPALLGGKSFREVAATRKVEVEE